MATCLPTSLEEKSKRLHNKLLYDTIAIDYLHSTVDKGIPEQRFRAGVKNYLDDPLSNSARDVTAILESLEQKGLIGLGDYDILRDIVQFDFKLMKEIHDIEIVFQSHGTPIFTRVKNGTEKKCIENARNSGKNTYSILFTFLEMLLCFLKDVLLSRCFIIVCLTIFILACSVDRKVDHASEDR